MNSGDVGGILAFVAARLGDREAAAEAAGGQRWICDPARPGTIVAPRGDSTAVRIEAHDDNLRAHVALNDPEYVRDDVASKRRILAACEREAARRHECAEGEARAWLMDEVVEALAAPVAGHPDYDPAWAF